MSSACAFRVRVRSNLHAASKDDGEAFVVREGNTFAKIKATWCEKKGVAEQDVQLKLPSGRFVEDADSLWEHRPVPGVRELELVALLRSGAQITSVEPSDASDDEDISGDESKSSCESPPPKKRHRQQNLVEGADSSRSDCVLSDAVHLGQGLSHASRAAEEIEKSPQPARRLEEERNREVPATASASQEVTAFTEANKMMPSRERQQDEDPQEKNSQQAAPVQTELAGDDLRRRRRRIHGETLLPLSPALADLSRRVRERSADNVHASMRVDPLVLFLANGIPSSWTSSLTTELGRVPESAPFSIADDTTWERFPQLLNVAKCLQKKCAATLHAAEVTKLVTGEAKSSLRKRKDLHAVLIVLGEKRQIHVKERSKRSSRARLVMQHGDVLIMSDEFHKRYMYGVPRSAYAGQTSIVIALQKSKPASSIAIEDSTRRVFKQESAPPPKLYGSIMQKVRAAPELAELMSRSNSSALRCKEELGEAPPSTRAGLPSSAETATGGRDSKPLPSNLQAAEEALARAYAAEEALARAYAEVARIKANAVA